MVSLFHWLPLFIRLGDMLFAAAVYMELLK